MARFINAESLGRPQLKILMKQSGLDLKEFVASNKRYFKSYRVPLSNVRDYLYRTVFTQNFERNHGRYTWRNIKRPATVEWRERMKLGSDMKPFVGTLGGLRKAATTSPGVSMGEHTTLQFRTSIGRKVEKGRVTHEGDWVTGSSEILDMGKDGASLKMEIRGETPNVTAAIWALHEGSRDGRIPARDFWFVSQDEHRHIRGMIRDWTKTMFERSISENIRRRKTVVEEGPDLRLKENLLYGTGRAFFRNLKKGLI